MKRLIVLFVALILLVACGSDKEKEESRDEMFGSANDNIDSKLAAESMNYVWIIEDHVKENEELDEDRLFKFTDEYLMDMDKFNDLNGYDQGLIMKTSEIITKSIKGSYEDVELFDEDIEDYYDILKNGDDMYIDGDTN